MKSWRMALAGIIGPALWILPGCGAEGEGSIKADRTTVGRAMVFPDRKASMPTRHDAQRGRTTQKANLPRR